MKLMQLESVLHRAFELSPGNKIHRRKAGKIKLAAQEKFAEMFALLRMWLQIQPITRRLMRWE
ncbi:MAG: hypothetical protein R3C26_00045 [Calditrichia bacterium]